MKLLANSSHVFATTVTQGSRSFTSPASSDNTTNRANPFTLYRKDSLCDYSPLAAAQWVIDNVAKWVPNSLFSVLPQQADEVGQKINCLRGDGIENCEDLKEMVHVTAEQGHGNCFETSLLCAWLLKEFGYPHDVELHALKGEKLNYQLDHCYLRILGPGESICVDPTAHTLHEFYKNQLHLPSHYTAYDSMENFKRVVIPWAHTDKHVHNLSTIKPILLDEGDSVEDVYQLTITKDFADDVTATRSEMVDEQILKTNFEKLCVDRAIETYQQVITYINALDTRLQAHIKELPELQEEYAAIDISNRLSEIENNLEINQKLATAKELLKQLTQLKDRIIHLLHQKEHAAAQNTYSLLQTHSKNMHLINEYNNTLLYLLWEAPAEMSTEDHERLTHDYGQLETEKRLSEIEVSDVKQKCNFSTDLKNRLLELYNRFGLEKYLEED